MFGTDLGLHDYRVIGAREFGETVDFVMKTGTIYQTI